MPLYKNTASQKLAVLAINVNNSPPTLVTSDAANITARISKDGGASAATNDTNPTELDATHHPGIYLFDLTQAETNADGILLSPTSSSSGVELDPLYILTESSTPQTGDSFARIGANGAGLSAVPWNASWDAEAQSEVDDALTSFWTSPDTLVDLVWDEVLTGGTHNVQNSAGRRLRQVDAAFVLHTGTAQAGGSNTITLDAGANANDDFYNHAKVVISDGTGVEQERIIVDYNGTTKVAKVAPPWITVPDNTSEFEVEPGLGHCETGWATIKVGLAQAATATTITLDSDADAADDYYNGDLIHLDAGTGEGQVRVITDYNGTTKVATVHAAWDTTPDTTSEYIVEEAHPYLFLYGPAGAGLTDLGGMSTGMKAEVEAEVDDALADVKGTGFNTSTDSLEAIRDRGDAAWAGGSSLTQQDVADALKLAPTAGSPAAGSVNADLDTLTTGVNVTQVNGTAVSASGITFTINNSVASDGTITVRRGTDYSPTIGTQIDIIKSGYASGAFTGGSGTFRYRQSDDTAATAAGSVSVSQSGDTVTATVTLTDTEVDAMTANVSGVWECDIASTGSLTADHGKGKFIVTDKVA